MQPILKIKDLSIKFQQEDEVSTAVNNISFSINKSSITAIVGESGSGKSLTALSILQLLPQQAKTTGSLLFYENENPIEFTKISTKELQNIRGNKIAMIFQEPMTSLNPLLTCGYQVAEVLIKHKKLSKEKAKEKTIALFKEVELPNPENLFNRYPHQLSGGQKQRVMIAMAISCNPQLLIADEPTTALDVRVQKSILDLLKKLQLQYQMSVLLITHDLGLVADVANEIIVLYKGEIVEQGNAKNILTNPQHDYTKALLMCRPNAKSKGKKLPVLNDFLKTEIVLSDEPVLTAVVNEVKQNEQPVLSVQSLKVYFPATTNFFGTPTSFHKAVDDVCFNVFPKETIGLVGESGCGKTTLGRTILQLNKPTSGNIFVNGKDIFKDEKNRSANRKEMQIVFQDPYGSLNPRITIADAIIEPMNVHHLFRNNKERKERAVELFRQVNLNPDHLQRYPHQFSGGQRQRICIARALALEPSFLIFDESVSALDVSVQAQVLNLINELKSTYQFTSIFISHDLSVVHYISDRIMVMKDGKIVEEGTADKIFFNPENEYTKQLIEAIPGGKGVRV